ncbi:MAG TPA: winged helix-turn-helix transcriptional regulator [Thermoplasmata archaeon]|nr:winged helix-turn-helix transcriptional regulator [Thermoplasmata archaeon]
MDQLDIRILRHLLQAQTVWPARPGLVASNRQVARALGVSPGTVRNRILKMVRTGFVSGFQVYPNPNALGLSSGSYAIEVPSTTPKPEVMRRLAKVEGVVFFENFRGNLLGLGITYSGPAALQRLLARINEVAHCPPGAFTHVEHPPATGPLTPAEWKLVARLMAGALVTYHQFATELGISIRTLKRRISRLVRSGAILSFPRMEFRAISGGVTAELLVTFADAASKTHAETEILHRVEDWMIFAGIWKEFDIYRLILPNVAVINDLAAEVARIDGVAFARAELVDGLVPNFDAMRPYVEERAASARVTAKRTVHAA